MVRRFHRSIYDELDELRASMDYLYLLALEPIEDPLLPESDQPAIVCQSLHNLDAEVICDADEVTVTVDIVPGTGNSKVSVDLIDADTLEITSERIADGDGELEGLPPGEQRYFSLHRTIPLPVSVIPREARVSLKHGVLDMRFKIAPHV
jgi:HSP20 family molecular chaperone IbpA